MKNPEDIYSKIGRFTEFYDLLLSIVGYKKSVEYFVSKLPFAPEEPIKVLDAGCGTGPYSFAVLKRYINAKVTAFDLDNRLISFVTAKARKIHMDNRVRAFGADIAGPLSEIAGEKFDLIITSGVLVYVSHEETVKNLARFLISGGYFLNVPNCDSTWGRFICKLYSCKPYSKSENISAFEKNGFVLVKDIEIPKTPAASFKEAYIFKYN